MPDISDELMFQIGGTKIYGRYFRQAYEVRSGTKVGEYADGMTAAVQNKFGQGQTLLMGSFPGAGYYLHHSPATKIAFLELLKSAGVVPVTTVDNASVQARLHRGPGGTYLWVTNATREHQTVTAGLSPAAGEFAKGEDIWGNQNVAINGRHVTVSIQERDAAVIALA